MKTGIETDTVGQVARVVTLANRRQEAAELRSNIRRLETVSQDTAYREGFRLAAVERQIATEEDGKVFLSGEGAKGILILGVHKLPDAQRARFIGAVGGSKARGNGALLALDGCRGEIRRNAAGTCWVIDLASPRGVPMFGWSAQTSGCGRSTKLGGPRLPTTNGGGHWCGLVSATMPISPEDSPKACAYAQAGMDSLAATGRTPMAQQAWENAERTALIARQSAAKSAVFLATEATGTTSRTRGHWGDPTGFHDGLMVLALAGGTAETITAHILAEQSAAEEAKLKAELEAEAKALAEAKAKAGAEARRIAAMERTLTACGLTQAQWDSMSPKSQGLAQHRARLAGKL